jgi:hypothetical protein
MNAIPPLPQATTPNHKAEEKKRKAEVEAAVSKCALQRGVVVSAFL